MKKIAIYLTNTDRSEFAARHESDAVKVVERLKGVGAHYDFSTYDVTKGQFPAGPTQYDAVILTGSPAYLDDGDEWIAHMQRDIRMLAAAKTPMIGLCFGHQAIIAALGGSVVRKDFWIFGATEMTIHNCSEWMTPPTKALKLYAANRAQASELPPGFDLLASASNCPIAMSALGNQVFTTQFHPEMDDAFIAALVDEYAEYLGPETTAQARASIKTPAQGDLFGQWMKNFIELPRP